MWDTEIPQITDTLYIMVVAQTCHELHAVQRDSPSREDLLWLVLSLLDGEWLWRELNTELQCKNMCVFSPWHIRKYIWFSVLLRMIIAWKENAWEVDFLWDTYLSETKSHFWVNHCNSEPFDFFSIFNFISLIIHVFNKRFFFSAGLRHRACFILSCGLQSFIQYPLLQISKLTVMIYALFCSFFHLLFVVSGPSTRFHCSCFLVCSIALYQISVIHVSKLLQCPPYILNYFCCTLHYTMFM